MESLIVNWIIILSYLGGAGYLAYRSYTHKESDVPVVSKHFLKQQAEEEARIEAHKKIDPDFDPEWNAFVTNHDNWQITDNCDNDEIY